MEQQTIIWLQISAGVLPSVLQTVWNEQLGFYEIQAELTNLPILSNFVSNMPN